MTAVIKNVGGDVLILVLVVGGGGGGVVKRFRPIGPQEGRWRQQEVGQEMTAKPLEGRRGTTGN